MAFEAILPRLQTTTLWESEGADINANAAKLQELFNSGKTTEYESVKSSLESDGAQFRLTQGKVYQIFPSDQEKEVPIKFQVKGGTITWYFIAPMDETKQTFRDQLYSAAALAHLEVNNSCERYYRGTNSFHVKKMHTNETESAFNHNHYRVLSGDVSVVDVRQHLFGLVQAQKDLNLMEESGRERFLDTTEATKICELFEKHVENQLKETSCDAEFTEEDLAEWAENKHLEEPCKTIDSNKPLNEKLELIKDSMRGIGSEKAQTRQMTGSKYATYTTVVTMDDKKWGKANTGPTQ